MKEIPFDKLIKNRKDVYIFSATQGKAINATLVSLNFNDQTASFLADGKSYSTVPFYNYGVTWSLDVNDLKPKNIKKMRIKQGAFSAKVCGKDVEIYKNNRLFLSFLWSPNPTKEEIEDYLRFLDNGYKRAQETRRKDK